MTNSFVDIELATTIVDTSVGHNGIAKNRNRLSQRDSSEISSSEISFSKVSSTQRISSKISPSKISPSKISSSEISHFQISPTQISPTQVSLINIGDNHKNSTQISSTQISSAKRTLTNVSPTQISPTQVSSSKIGISQLSSTQINSTQIDPFEIGITDVGIGKFPLSSSISSQDFVNVVEHNSTPEIINRLNNSATNIWSNLLQPSTQLDIDFQITDLPRGQLAEATIAGFDDDGQPNTGTIRIDLDANGLGWFIDRTPLDNSEFIYIFAIVTC